jgi:hypothetical protein
MEGSRLQSSSYWYFSAKSTGAWKFSFDLFTKVSLYVWRFLMIIQDLECLDLLVQHHDEVKGAASISVWASAGATATGQYTRVGTFSGTATFTASFRISS